MPNLRIDLAKIEDNARLVAGMLAPYDIRLVGVTKACLGNWHVAGAMVAGGATALADSRAASIARLRRHLPGIELELLRSQVGEEPIDTASDLYYVSSVAQAQALLPLVDSRPLRLCLVIETGDGREGIVAQYAAAEAVRISALPGMNISGIATNAACAGNTPSPASLRESLERFREAAATVLQSLEPTFRDFKDSVPARVVISAGGSGLLRLLLDDDGSGHRGREFAWLTEMRCGEALLLGKIPHGNGDVSLLPGAHGDAFILEAPVLEVAAKGTRLQVLVGLGIQDFGAGSLTPLSPELAVVQATSDYLAITVNSGDTDSAPAVGDRLAFIPSYHALLAAMTSPFVEKEPFGKNVYEGGVYSPSVSGSEDSVTDS